MSKFCENCGCVIDENETFCHMCGTPVSSSQEQGTTVLSEDQGTTVLPQDNGSDKNSQYQNQSFTNENTSSNSSDQQNYNDQNSFYSANYNSSSQIIQQCKTIFLVKAIIIVKIQDKTFLFQLKYLNTVLLKHISCFGRIM